MLPYFNHRSSSFIACLILILLASLAVYSQTFFFGFVFDDHLFITQNQAIRSWHDLFNFFAHDFPFNRLLTIASFTLNYQLYGLNPAGYHIFNFMIHLSAVSSVWWLFRILIVHSHHTSSTKIERLSWLAFFGALIFAVHPVQTQAVTYITQRFSSLSALFYILTICSYIRARQSVLKKSRAIYSILALISAILSILSKEESITLPIMIAAVEVFLFSDRPGLITRKIWIRIFLGTLAFLIIFFSLFKTNLLAGIYLVRIPSESHDGDILTLGTYLLTQAKVLNTFLKLLIWPFPQTLDHDYPMARSLFDLTALWGLAVLSALIISAKRLKDPSPLLSFGIMWVIITFSANLVPRAHVIWEHRLYLISTGAFLCFIMALDKLIRSSKILFSLLTILTIAFGIVSFKRNHVWRNDITLWSDAVSKAPQKSRTLINAGDAYAKHGQTSRALPLLEKAKKLYPLDHFVARSFASYYFNQRLFKQSAVEYETTIRLQESSGLNASLDDHRHLGLSYEGLKQFSLALVTYDKILTKMPLNPDIYVWRAGVYRKMGQMAKAKKDLLTALRISPQNMNTMIGIAELLKAEGNFAEAEKILDQMIAGYPQSEGAYLARANYYLLKGDANRARRDIKQALKLNPEYTATVIRLLQTSKSF